MVNLSVQIHYYSLPKTEILCQRTIPKTPFHLPHHTIEDWQVTSHFQLTELGILSFSL